MNFYGIKGPLIKWFENYLYQRKQKVINRATQGSVFTPLLFLIYINDIGEKLLSLSRLFADYEKLKLYLMSVLENNIISV
jgi:hypothetical protein